MSNRLWGPLLCALVAVLPVAGRADDEPTTPKAKPTAAAEKDGLIVAPTADAVKSRVMEWVASQAPKADVLEKAGKALAFGEETLTSEELFEAALTVFQIVDADTAKLVKACKVDSRDLVPPAATPLAKKDVTPFFKGNLQLFYGRYLVHRQMYEHAHEVLAATKIADVIDPAALLFYRATCEHQLLMKAEGLKTLKQLLHETSGVPVRYTSLATLMEYDLTNLKEKTLDEVAKKMSEVERNLGLGRPGERVQKREEEIIATLDELIKKMEDQAGGGGGGGGGQGNSGNQSSGPAGDSSVKGATAPGDVDKKKFESKDPWGTLPPKERAKVKDILEKDLPALSRDVMSKYAAKLARRPAETGK